MESPAIRGNDRRRKEQRLGIVRRRATLASALGFAAFLALAAQHAVGSATKAATRSPAAAPTRYFDEQSTGFGFADPSATSVPPPVAQTHVS